MPPTIWTVGHSNRSAEDFIALLTPAGIELVADVRRFAGSRRHPHFGSEQLPAALDRVGIAYRHFPELGGRRTERLPDSPNTAWRVESFNAYADHMQSPEFRGGLEALMEAAAASRTAIMCAEALPWRCHRRLIADALIARGWRVVDIMGTNQEKDRSLTEFAKTTDDHQVIYPGETLF
ncbi:MAG: DUF488 domain-containing protein [Pirellulales bacterium]